MYISLGEMYKVAGSYKKGSAEYNHVMEVAAKTYPTQTAAAVNAARAEIGPTELRITHYELRIRY